MAQRDCYASVFFFPFVSLASWRCRDLSSWEPGCSPEEFALRFLSWYLSSCDMTQEKASMISGRAILSFSVATAALLAIVKTLGSLRRDGPRRCQRSPPTAC